MTNETSIEARVDSDPDNPDASTVSHPPDAEFPDVPYPIFRRAVGSPYYIDPRLGGPVFLSRPGTPPLTSEDVRRELEDFP